MDAPKWLNGYSGQSVDELLSLEGKYRDFTIALGTDVFFSDGLSRAQRTAYGYAGCRVGWHSGESVDRADIRIDICCPGIRADLLLSNLALNTANARAESRTRFARQPGERTAVINCDIFRSPRGARML